MQEQDVYFDEAALGGFHQIHIEITTEQLLVDMFVPTERQEAYEKQQDLNEYMATILHDNATEVNRSYLEAVGSTIDWQNLQTILYYEEDTKHEYSFFVALSDHENDCTIKAKVDKTTSKRPSPSNMDVLDAPTTQQDHLLRESYLSDCYDWLLKQLIAPTTDLLHQRYKAQLEQGETLYSNHLKLQKEGLLLSKGSWIFRKKSVVPWQQLKIERIGNSYIISDKKDPAFKASIPKKSFRNKDVFIRLINGFTTNESV